MTITLILIIIVIIFAAVAAALIIQAQEEAEKNETSAKEEFVGICKSAIETASQCQGFLLIHLTRFLYRSNMVL